MKIKNTINQQIIAAAVGMLTPFVKGLTPTRLIAAIQNYDDSSNTTESPPKQQLFTIEQAREILMLSKPSIFKLINDGKLERIKLGAASRITGQSLEKLIETGTE